MQLRFAGVLEVVRIKKEGYPYREKFERFYARRVVQSGLYRVLKLPRGFDDTEQLKEACRSVCLAALGEPEVKRSAASPRKGRTLKWQLGNTMVFGKDDLPTRIIEWHQRRVANVVRCWFRYHHQRRMIRDVLRGVEQLGAAWRAEVMRRKYEKLVKTVHLMQQLTRCALATHFLNANVQILSSARKVQVTWRDWHMRQQWQDLIRRVVRERQMRSAVGMVKKIWRQKHVQWKWTDIVLDLRDIKIKKLLNRMQDSVVVGTCRNSVVAQHHCVHLPDATNQY